MKVFALFFGLAWWCNLIPAHAQRNEDNKIASEKIVIVYLSRTSNTKSVAEIIHATVGGTLVPLELIKPYPADYKATVAQVVRENETGILPLLKTKIDTLSHYEVIFIGFPTWDMQLPPPLKSFLKQNNLSGKIIIPFNTNGGYGVGNSFETVKRLCANSKILEGYTVKGGVERDGILFVMEGDKEQQVANEVKKWLTKINILGKSE